MRNFGGNRKLSKQYRKQQKRSSFIYLRIRTFVLFMPSESQLWQRIYSLRGESAEYGVDLAEYGDKALSGS
jgi:hypothetical protein